MAEMEGAEMDYGHEAMEMDMQEHMEGEPGEMEEMHQMEGEEAAPEQEGA